MASPESTKIAERVRSQLAIHRISGSEIARRLGLTQSYVNRRLRGAVAWRAADIELIAAELKVPVSVFIESPEVAA